MEPKQRNLFITGVVISAALLMLLIFFLQTSPSYNRTDREHLSGDVYVEKTEELEDMLFDLQYYTVQIAISDYVKARIDPSTGYVAINSKVSVTDDGILIFDVVTTEPDSEFTVNIDRQTHFDKIIFSVPETNYKKTIDVYESSPQD